MSGDPIQNTSAVERNGVTNPDDNKPLASFDLVAKIDQTVLECSPSVWAESWRFQTHRNADHHCTDVGH